MSDIAERVKKIVVEHLGVEADKVTESASFIDDLGADSLDTVELVMAFEEEFGIEIPDAEVIRWLTFNAAKVIGVEKQTGSLAAGKMADVVLWNGNPLSVYARPEKVWVDGALLYDNQDRKRRAVSDFELGQPGEGDVK